MNLEEFRALVERSVAHHDKVLRTQIEGAAPDWDIVNPLYFAHVEIDGESEEAFMALVNSSLIPTQDELDKDQMMSLFRHALGHVKAHAGGILCGAWIRDPDTNERVGEAIVLTIEDDRNHQAITRWALTRNEGATPTLAEHETIIVEGEDEIGGRMTGFFPPSSRNMN